MMFKEVEQSECFVEKQIIFVTFVPRTHGVSDFRFAYDHIFQPGVSQADIYHTVAKPIVEGVINGFLDDGLGCGSTAPLEYVCSLFGDRKAIDAMSSFLKGFWGVPWGIAVHSLHAAFGQTS